MCQVFDGHGGTSAAEFARKHLLGSLLAHAAFPGRPAEALRGAFVTTDEAYYRAVHRAEAPERDAGATALAALVWGGRLVVANAGDSRAVLSRRGRAISLSRDHKPSCPGERERVASAGARRTPHARFTGNFDLPVSCICGGHPGILLAHVRSCAASWRC